MIHGVIGSLDVFDGFKTILIHTVMLLFVGLYVCFFLLLLLNSSVKAAAISLLLFPDYFRTLLIISEYLQV